MMYNVLHLLPTWNAHSAIWNLGCGFQGDDHDLQDHTAS
jgi:hypothetical protein